MTQSWLRTRDINTAIKVLQEVQHQLMRNKWNDHGFYEPEDPEVIGLYEARLTLERLDRAGEMK